MSVLLAATAATLFGIGTYLVLQRKLSRVIIGVGLIGHGANVLLITAGRRGRSPIVGSSDPSGFADPVPQALALTAIVISFGVTALLLALAYRSWLLTHDDEIADDVEDRQVAAHGHSDAELVDAAAVSHVDPEAEPDPDAAHDREDDDGIGAAPAATRTRGDDAEDRP